MIITDDNRQLVEWVVRGKYPIAIGLSRTLLIPFVQQGLGKNVVGLDEKILRTVAGTGTIYLLEGAPHLNAARVYINWLLSQKAQINLSKYVEHNSSRADVPPVEEPVIELEKLSQYRNGDTEENTEFSDRLLPLIKEAMKR